MAYDRRRYLQIKQMTTGKLVECMIIRSQIASDSVIDGIVCDNEFIWAMEELNVRFSDIDKKAIEDHQNDLNEYLKSQRS